MVADVVKFGTVQVYEEMAKLLNSDPEWLEKGKWISYSMVYDYREPVGKTFFVRFDEGRVVEVKEIGSVEEEPADFVIGGAPDVWRGVLGRSINPTAALTRGQLKLKGKMSVLLKNMEAFGYIIDSMTKVKFED